VVRNIFFLSRRRAASDAKRPERGAYIPPLVVVCVVVVELAGGCMGAGADVVLSSDVVVVDVEAGMELSLAQPARVKIPAAARDDKIRVFM